MLRDRAEIGIGRRSAMPVLAVRCPDCGHEFRSLVVPGARVPPVWVCSACGSRRAEPYQVLDDADHPLSGGPGCACCG